MRDKEAIVVRRFGERDAGDIIEIHRVLGWSTSEKAVKGWSEESDYTLRLVAEAGGRAVGKVILDTAYPPYSELVNLMVHPEHRRLGVASRMVRECLRLAEARGCPFTLLMTERDNMPAQGLYKRHGFASCITGAGDEKHIWMIRLPEGSAAASFEREHPYAESTTPEGRKKFHDRSLYVMEWNDTQTRDRLELYLEGQPGQPREGGTAPRIAGISLRSRETSLGLLIREKDGTIDVGEEASFALKLSNEGRGEIQIARMDYLAPRGIELTAEPTPRALKPGEGSEILVRARMTRGFEVPILSFPTVLVTCIVEINGIDSPIPVTAGFERA